MKVCIRLVYFLLLTLPGCTFIEEGKMADSSFSPSAKDLLSSLDDSEIHLLANGWKTMDIGGQLPVKLSDIPITPEISRNKMELGYESELKTEYEFTQFHLLRGLIKKVVLVWYDENGLLDEIIESYREGKKYIYDDKRKSSFVIHADDNDFDEWKGALTSTIIRTHTASTIISIGGYGGAHATPPHGIVIYTNKECLFIGITKWGFHLGKWESNTIDQSKLFFCPALAFFLKDYVEKTRLEKFPKMLIDQAHVDVLSGKVMFDDELEGLMESDCPKDLDEEDEEETDVEN